jgi:hypothetical protein
MAPFYRHYVQSIRGMLWRFLWGSKGKSGAEIAPLTLIGCGGSDAVGITPIWPIPGVPLHTKRRFFHAEPQAGVPQWVIRPRSRAPRPTPLWWERSNCGDCGDSNALREIEFLTRSLNSLACLFYFVLVPLLELPVFVKSDAIGYLIIAQNLWRSSRCHARLEILQCLTNAL